MCFCELLLKPKDLRRLTNDPPVVPMAPRERLINET